MVWNCPSSLSINEEDGIVRLLHENQDVIKTRLIVISIRSSKIELKTKICSVITQQLCIQIKLI